MIASGSWTGGGVTTLFMTKASGLSEPWPTAPSSSTSRHANSAAAAPSLVNDRIADGRNGNNTTAMLYYVLLTAAAAACLVYC